MSESDKLPLWRIILLVAVAAGLLYYLDHRFQVQLFHALFGGGAGRGSMMSQGDEGEERPPVVVTSGGSIDFEAQSYGFGHGKLEDDGPQQIKHTSSKASGPAR